MSVQTIRFHTHSEDTAETTQRIESLLAALHAAAPPQLRYLALRQHDEPVFTLILELAEGADNPLPAIDEAASFRDWLPDHTHDDTVPKQCSIIGKYYA